MAKATLGALDALHEQVATHFSNMLASGEVEAKDISNILKFLKDNDVTVDTVESSPMQNILDQFKMNREDLEASL